MAALQLPTLAPFSVLSDSAIRSVNVGQHGLKVSNIENIRNF
jgi:hypothetical protein